MIVFVTLFSYACLSLVRIKGEKTINFEYTMNAIEY